MGTMKDEASFRSENPGYAYAGQTAGLQHRGQLTTDWLTSAMTGVNNDSCVEQSADAYCGRGTDRRPCVSECKHRTTTAYATTLIVSNSSQTKCQKKSLLVRETTKYVESSDISIMS